MSTGRHNIEAALSLDGARDIPVVVPYEGVFIRDHWDELTGAPWWQRASPQIDDQLAWRRKVIRGIGQDWFDLPACAPRAVREHLSLRIENDQAWIVDHRAGTRRQIERETVGGWSPRGGIESIHPRRLAERVAEIDAFIPLPDSADPRALPDDGRHALARALLAEFGASHFPMGYVAAPLWRTYDVWGFEGMMTMIATRPDLARYACTRLLTEALWTVRAAAARGCAGVWIEDCMTDMIHPDDFASLNLPFVRAITDEIRACGMKSVYYYCGNPAGKWPHLLDAGADALSLEESKKGFAIDIDDIVERVNGRCAVLGNLDTIGVLEQAPQQRLRAEIARQIAAGRRNGSRFVMSLGSPVTPGTPGRRVRLYCDLAREMGQAVASASARAC